MDRETASSVSRRAGRPQLVTEDFRRSLERIGSHTKRLRCFRFGPSSGRGRQRRRQHTQSVVPLIHKSWEKVSERALSHRIQARSEKPLVPHNGSPTLSTIHLFHLQTIDSDALLSRITDNQQIHLMLAVCAELSRPRLEPSIVCQTPQSYLFLSLQYRFS